jgi:hypothetical protein
LERTAATAEQVNLHVSINDGASVPIRYALSSP